MRGWRLSQKARKAKVHAGEKPTKAKVGTRRKPRKAKVDGREKPRKANKSQGKPSGLCISHADRICQRMLVDVGVCR
jgi:hypothetical protein